MKKYGLLSGLVFAGWLYLAYLAGLTKSAGWPYLSFLPFIVYAVFIMLCMLEKRKAAGGFIDFRDAARSGFGVSAIAGIIYSISQYVYAKWIDTGAALEQAEAGRKILIGQGKDPAEVQEQVNRFIAGYPFRTSIFALAMVVFTGGVLSVLIALVVKKKRQA